ISSPAPFRALHIISLIVACSRKRSLLFKLESLADCDRHTGLQGRNADLYATAEFDDDGSDHTTSSQGDEGNDDCNSQADTITGCVHGIDMYPAQVALMWSVSDETPPRNPNASKLVHMSSIDSIE